MVGVEKVGMVGQPTDKKGRNYKGKHFDHLFNNTIVVILLLLNKSITKELFCHLFVIIIVRDVKSC